MYEDLTLLRSRAVVKVTVGRYQKRISGPMMDRIDIHVEVPRVPYEKLAGEGREASCLASSWRRRVLCIRQVRSK